MHKLRINAVWETKNVYGRYFGTLDWKLSRTLLTSSLIIVNAIKY